MNKSQFLRLCAGKLGLMAVAICSTFAVSSCVDDEVLDRSDKTPLQISVNTVSGVSRTLIHDDFLPGGSSIGLSLYNSADGLDYDSQGYANIKFTATGDGADQTWGTTGLAPSVSANEATLVAYYPYNGADDLDLTAVPVETASQTDYMFSGPVTGINNTNADKVEITMHHALTAVRVQLVLGNYTGNADVAGLSVSSTGLGTSGVLNAATGGLSSVAGVGKELSLSANFTLDAAGTDTDFLLVPDVQVYTGKTVITATIGGKKYAAGIDFMSAYKQGYIYTHVLTLNNTGFQVTQVKVKPWGEGDKVQTIINTNPTTGGKYVVKIKAKDETQSDIFYFTHNVVGFVGTIDWGDGTVDTYSEPIDWPEHKYSNDGKTYTILAKGTITALTNSGSNSGFGTSLQNIVYIENKCNIKSLKDAFRWCTNLQTIPEGLFDKCTEVTNFSYLFAGCSNLQTIPEGLFDNCTKVTDFGNLFAGCEKLQEIPAGLFDNCTEVTSFYQTFSGCSSLKSIPGGLFDNCTKVTDFNSTFCSKGLGFAMDLVIIPEGLFDKCTEVTDFSYLFAGCSNLQTIPEGLFDKCTEVTRFEGTFTYCTSLESIPEGLFRYNTLVYSYNYVFNSSGIQLLPAFTFGSENSYLTFNNAFEGCSNLKTIKSDAFYCKNLGNFGALFKNMLSLEKIEAGAFNCPNMTSFNNAFTGCLNLTEISGDIFKYNTKVTDFYYCFSNTAITLIPEGLFDACTEVTDFGGTFAGCSKLQEIPIGLFDKCTKVAYFDETFKDCTILTGESPYTIIDVDGVDTKVHLYERSLYPDYFTAPTNYGECFRGDTYLTDYSTIPSEWK